MSAEAISDALLQSIKSAASPVTSGKDELFDVTTGAPAATVLVAASVVVTMLTVPIVTAWWAKKISS